MCDSEFFRSVSRFFFSSFVFAFSLFLSLVCFIREDLAHLSPHCHTNPQQTSIFATLFHLFFSLPVSSTFSPSVSQKPQFFAAPAIILSLPSSTFPSHSPYRIIIPSNYFPLLFSSILLSLQSRGPMNHRQPSLCLPCFLLYLWQHNSSITETTLIC